MKRFFFSCIAVLGLAFGAVALTSQTDLPTDYSLFGFTITETEPADFVLAHEVAPDIEAQTVGNTVSTGHSNHLTGALEFVEYEPGTKRPITSLSDGNRDPPS